MLKSKKSKQPKISKRKKKEHLLDRGEKFNNHFFFQNLHDLRDDFFYRSSELESKCIGIKVLRLFIHVLNPLPKFRN